MIEARVSGIMFTANPNNGNVQELLISSLYGAGEGIVSAGLDADLYTFSKMTGEISADISQKTTQFVFDKINKSGVEKIDVQDELRNVNSLKDEHVKEIAAKGILIENHFGKPQDIEFSIDYEGDLFILQSRPITTLKEYGPAAGNRMIWDNSNIIESYSGPTTPMTFSFIRRAYTIVYHCFAEVMGISPKKVKESRHVFENMLGLFQGQVYYNIISWYRLVRMFPGFHFNKTFMESMMGVKEKVELEEFNEPEMGFFRKYFVELPDLLSLLLRSIYNFARIDKLVTEFRHNFDTHYANWSAIDFSTKTPNDLMLLYRHMEDKLLWNWKTPIINDFYVMIFYGALKRCCSTWFDDENSSLQNDLICGEGDIESTQPTKMLMEIARQVKENPKEVDFFNRHSHVELARLVPDSKEHSEIAKFVDEYLDKYGFRSINELKLEEPSMQETPQFVYQVIKNYLKMDDKALDPELQEKREKEIRHLAEQKAAAKLTGGFSLLPRKFIFQWVLRNARKGVKNRENMRFARTKIYGLLRELINAMGDKFAHENIIEKDHDIYYLSIDEVWDYIKGTAITSNIDELIQLRKKEFSVYNSPEASSIADHFETYGMAYHHNLYQGHTTVEENSGNDSLKGIGCCPGQITQKVKIVESPRSDLSLQGEILVAARTDPGWVPLYPAVSGILIERGSILSHSAIVAREMGIPTIVGIPNLLTTLQDGQTVTMDGKTGIVTVAS
jgi:pyruvate,water dikinase